MSEAIYATDPSVMDEQMTDMYVADQIALMEQREFGFTPIEAYEVGRIALGPSVEIAEVGARPPESHAREVAANMWHSYTPYAQENAAMYGGEADRLQAVETVRGIAEQARLTGKFFDGRHKRLSRQLDTGEIAQDEHDQAVGALMTGLALTNPQHLRQVGEAQRAAIERRVKAGALPEGTRFIDVTSRVGKNGEIELAGMDAVVARMTGASSQTEFAQHGIDLKSEFYGQDALAKAKQRHAIQQEELRAYEAAMFEAQAHRMIELLDKDDAEKKRQKR